MNETQMRSRRSILAAVAGAAAALIGHSLSMPRSVLADGEAIEVGGDYPNSHTVTRIRNTSLKSSAAVFGAESSGSGPALYGQAASGVGVLGGSDQYTGIGVLGNNPYGIAIKGSSGTAGYALVADGRVSIETSGIAIIPAGSNGVSITPTRALRSGTVILLTPLANLGGRSLWYTADIPANKFGIRISSTRSSQTKVAWLLLDKFSPPL